MNRSSAAISSEPVTETRPNKADAGNGSKAICRVSNVLRSQVSLQP